MVTILVCSVVLIVIGFYLMVECFEGLGSTILTFGCVGLMTYSCLVFGYYGAEYRAKILNKEYGTSYTQEEVFYASDVIEAVQNIKRKRIELMITGESDGG